MELWKIVYCLSIKKIVEIVGVVSVTQWGKTSIGPRSYSQIPDIHLLLNIFWMFFFIFGYRTLFFGNRFNRFWGVRSWENDFIIQLLSKPIQFTEKSYFFIYSLSLLIKFTGLDSHIYEFTEAFYYIILLLLSILISHF